MSDLPLDTTDLRWLARLARALLGEADAADDLVQDTLDAALRQDRRGGPLSRAWLGGVARRLAARRFRTEVRRGRREDRASRPAALPDPAELVERAEVAARVAAAARSLSEPFRRTLLLRFLEGASVEDIARNEGKPADTIRWRIRKGLQLLREELMRGRDGDWRSWCVLLLPLARSGGHAGAATAGASGTLAGIVAMGTAMKLVMMVTATICGVGLCAFWLMGQEPNETDGYRFAERPRESRAPMATEPDTTDLDRPVETPADAIDTAPFRAEPGRSRVPSPTPTPIWGLEGRVIEPNGAPVPEAIVYVVAAAEEDAETSARSGEPLLRCEADAIGRFRFEALEWKAVQSAQERGLDLGVVANGFLRTVVADVVAGAGGEPLLVVLERGRSLRGRVMDPDGRSVPGITLLAHTTGAAIDHVSPSQSLLRAGRAALGDAVSRYQHCRSQTDARGEVSFSGLPEGDLVVRSLDPGWTIVAPNPVQASDRFVTWTAKPCLGVRVEVVDQRTGARMQRVSAKFFVEVTLDDGETKKWGQWVGRGVGEVSFLLTSSMLPPLGGRSITRATFYGEVKAAGVRTEWRATPLENPAGATGVAEVQVAIDTADPESVTAKRGAATPEVPAAPPSSATVELDVAFSDGSICEEPLTVNWTLRTEAGREWDGEIIAKALAGGRYRFAVPPGEVRLKVAERNASGSLPTWRETIRCEADRISRRQVTLKRGGTVTVHRPEEWSGNWSMRASWRDRAEDEWRGSWEYGTQASTLTLRAVRAAEWRYELRLCEDRTSQPLIRRVLVTAGQHAHSR